MFKLHSQKESKDFEKTTREVYPDAQETEALPFKLQPSRTSSIFILNFKT